MEPADEVSRIDEFKKMRAKSHRLRAPEWNCNDSLRGEQTLGLDEDAGQPSLQIGQRQFRWAVAPATVCF